MRHVLVLKCPKIELIAKLAKGTCRFSSMQLLIQIRISLDNQSTCFVASLGLFIGSLRITLLIPLLHAKILILITDQSQCRRTPLNWVTSAGEAVVRLLFPIGERFSLPTPWTDGLAVRASWRGSFALRIRPADPRVPGSYKVLRSNLIEQPTRLPATPQ